MQLKEMEVRSRIVGTQVEATTTLTFFNPNHRQLEGDLAFPLPDGAVVTGYALDVNGKLRDGVVVKKEKARVAFETEVRRGVDPGLVEQVAGNVYRTRIYPLPPQGVRKIRLRYVAELPANDKGDAAWHLPLPMGETVEKLAIRVEVAQGAVTPEIGGFGNLRFKTFENIWVAETEVSDAKPGEDLWVALPKLPPQVSAVERTGDGDAYFAISDLPGPAAQTADAPAPAKLGIAWDASGSRSGAPLEKQLATLKELLQRWPRLEITLLVFRDRPEKACVFQGDAEALMKGLKEVRYDGGTDFALLADSLKEHPAVEQWLLFTDGFDTLSDKLPDFSRRRVTAVVSQSVAHRELLRQVCADSGGQVVDLQRLEPVAAAESIVHPAPRVVGVQGSGIAEVQGVGATVFGRVSLHGKLVAEETELSLEYSDGRHSPPVKLRKKGAAEGNLLATVWAAGRVNQLAVRAEANEDELLALGRRFGIVSPVTSLIVLENVDQYVRNDIEPPVSEPDLRSEWRERKDSIAKTEQQTRGSKLEQVLGMWKARVAWWEKTYKVPPDFKWRADEPRKTRGGHSFGYSAMPGAPAPGGAQRLERQSSPDALTTAPASTMRVDAAPAPSQGQGAARTGGAFAKNKEGAEPVNQATITVKPWDPSTPYLAALKAAAKEGRYEAYLNQRKTYENSPAFFVDCGEYFLREGDTAIGVRVLTNLAEMKLEDAALIRVLAWRLQQAGEFDRAIVLLRKVGKLRPEEPQSLRDLALALAERGKARHTPGDITEAMALLDKMILSEWERFPEIELVALEELNALMAWSKSQEWAKSPTFPALDERLRKNLEVDVRIVMSWDADNTDVDLHVLEPSGQEAFFSQNRTAIGGLVSHDFTQGYGPEEYMVRRALPGAYKILAHYYGSRQQTVTGPTTITATIFTDFGRPTEKKQVLTLRLDQPHDKADMGQIQVGGGAPGLKEGCREESPHALRDGFRALRVGQSADEVQRLVGNPVEKKNALWIYRADGREYRVRIVEGKGVVSVAEALPGGAEMILVQ